MGWQKISYWLHKIKKAEEKTSARNVKHFKVVDLLFIPNISLKLFGRNRVNTVLASACQMGGVKIMDGRFINANAL